jgi:hypothetical protein
VSPLKDCGHPAISAASKFFPLAPSLMALHYPAHSQLHCAFSRRPRRASPRRGQVSTSFFRERGSRKASLFELFPFYFSSLAQEFKRSQFVSMLKNK